MSTFQVNPEVISIEDTETTHIQNLTHKSSDGKVDEIICVDTNGIEGNENDTAVNSILDNGTKTVSYSDVLELATDLYRTVSDNPNLCKSTYSIYLIGLLK